MTSVMLALEFEHKATIRKIPNLEGFTHDWYVLVKGAPELRLNEIIEKVVFHLHPSYPFPRRVVRDAPYVIRECGFAGFCMNIEIFLKVKEESKKVNVYYDLKLCHDRNVHQLRKESFVIDDPLPSVLEMIIKSGGEVVRSNSKLKNKKKLPPTKRQKTGEVRKYKKRKVNETSQYIPLPNSIPPMISNDPDNEGDRPVKRLKVLLPRNRIEQAYNNGSSNPYY